jgi:hypothetical protein
MYARMSGAVTSVRAEIIALNYGWWRWNYEWWRLELRVVALGATSGGALKTSFHLIHFGVQGRHRA